jgi:AraC-like DNA-binding protein
MILTLDWKNFLFLAGIVIGFLVGFLLLTYGFKKNKWNQLLGISFIFLTLATIVAWMISSRLIVYFPMLYRTGNIFALLYIPLVYLYIKNIVKKQSLKWKDVIHLVPAFIYFLDYLPTFLLPADQKVNLILLEITDSYQYMAFNQSQFFPSNFWIFFRNGMVLFYWVLSTNLLIKHHSTVGDINRYFGKEWVNWMKIYLIFQLGLVLPLGSSFFELTSIAYIDIIHLPVALLIVSSGGAILFFPKVLYGTNEFDFLIASKQISKEDIEEEEENQILSEEKISEIKQILQELEKEKKFFQTQGYAIRDLAKDTGIPSYILTLYINRVLETNFSDFINEKRIHECSKMMQEGNFSHYTLEGLAETCGFSNRNSFLSAFKKFKGMTPSAFKKEIKEGNLTS